MPNEPGVAVLAVALTDRAGAVLHRNFTTFVVEGPRPDEVTLADGRRAHVARIDPAAFSDARWSRKQWNVLDGLKVNGAGSRALRIPPALAEGARPLRRGRGHVPGRGFGQAALRQGPAGRARDVRRLHARPGHPRPEPEPQRLSDDGRDAVPERGDGAGQRRGRRTPRAAGRPGRPPRDPVLALAAQGQEAAGSGLLRVPVEVPIPRAALEKAAAEGALQIRLEVDEALPGGLAIYGARFGRYPVDPTVVFVRK